MPRERLHRLERDDVLLAARMLKTWGMPRKLGRDELVLGHFYLYGARTIYWLTPDGDAQLYAQENGLDPMRTWAVHLWVAPGSAGFNLRRVHQAIVWTADLANLQGLLSKPDKRRRERLGRVHEALGWRRVGVGWYLSLA